MRPLDPQNPDETPRERYQREVAAEVQRKTDEKDAAEEAEIEAAAIKRAAELRAEREATAAQVARQTAVDALAVRKLSEADAAAKERRLLEMVNEAKTSDEVFSASVAALAAPLDTSKP